jgi:hypothetical protein
VSKFFLFASDYYDSAWAFESFRGNFLFLDDAKRAIVISPSERNPGEFVGELDKWPVEWAEILTLDSVGNMIKVADWWGKIGDWEDYV